MSMLGNFRQVSPALLGRMKANPGLTRQVVRWRPEEPTPQSDAEALLSLVPAHMRKAIASMPPEARAELLAHVDKQVANMPAEVRAEVLGARKPRPARKKSAPIESADMGEELDLEKAWHGIHFLLCGSAGESPETLGTAVLGGKELGPDLGYGPARYLEAADVKEIASALKRVTAEELGARFNAAALDEAKVYPGGWGADEDRREWLLEGFAELRSFYESAAENGFGVLLYIV